MKYRNLSMVRNPSIIISFFLLLSSCGCDKTNSDADKDRPNVILILADDMAYGDLSRINGGLSRTPNLDQLAKESVWFSQGYSAAPVCAPARAALLTGKYPHQTGCVTLGMKRFPELTKMDQEMTTLADVFQLNGYSTGMIGKWHCGEGQGYHPMDRGFQEFEGFLGYMVNSYFTYELDMNRTYQPFTDRYLTHHLSERAVEFVRRHKNHPFFLHLAHYAPHRPLDAPPEIVQSFLEKGFEINTAIIYAMIQVMDQGIGELIAELEDLGIREKTLIIFSSDNGPDPIPGERNNRGLRGTKYTVYEGGIHVPFFVNWKGRLEPAKRDQLVHFTDVFPTLVELCDLELAEPIEFEGGSIAGLLQDTVESQLPGERFWQWSRGVPDYSHNAAMRQGRWKLVRPFVTRGVPEGPSDHEPVLFDLENDPSEQVDVSRQNRRIYENMKVMLESWCRDVEYDRLKNKND